MHVDPNNSFGAARDEMHNGGLSKAESAVNNSKVVGNYHRVASILPYHSCNYEKKIIIIMYVLYFILILVMTKR